jgi:cell division topological specificity factor
MGLLDFFRSQPRKGSAGVARERLQILVAHDRSERGRPSYLPKLQSEILAVIRKYVHVDQDAISVKIEQDEHREVLELEIVLPEGGNPRS